MDSRGRKILTRHREVGFCGCSTVYSWAKEAERPEVEYLSKRYYYVGEVCDKV